MSKTLAILQALEFAAYKHRDQRRKGPGAVPYINHPIAVAHILANEGLTNETLIIAAILHDLIEDTDTSYGEIKSLFSEDVANLVLAVTDDKNLPKAVRKDLQIEHAAGSSPMVKQLKIADKIANISDDLPHSWPRKRRLAYLDWAEKVMVGLRGTNEMLESLFDSLMKDARIREEREYI